MALNMNVIRTITTIAIVQNKPPLLFNEHPNLKIEDLHDVEGFSFIATAARKLLCDANCREGLEGRCSLLNERGEAFVYRDLVSPNCKS